MSRWYFPQRKAELTPETQRDLCELRAATEACEQRYDITAIDRLVRAAKRVSDTFGVDLPAGETFPGKTPMAAAHTDQQTKG